MIKRPHAFGKLDSDPAKETVITFKNGVKLTLCSETYSELVSAINSDTAKSLQEAKKAHEKCQFEHKFLWQLKNDLLDIFYERFGGGAFLKDVEEVDGERLKDVLNSDDVSDFFGFERYGE